MSDNLGYTQEDVDDVFSDIFTQSNSEESQQATSSHSGQSSRTNRSDERVRGHQIGRSARNTHNQSGVVNGRKHKLGDSSDLFRKLEELNQLVSDQQTEMNMKDMQIRNLKSQARQHDNDYTHYASPSKRLKALASKPLQKPSKVGLNKTIQTDDVDMWYNKLDMVLQNVGGWGWLWQARPTYEISNDVYKSNRASGSQNMEEYLPEFEKIWDHRRFLTVLLVKLQNTELQAPESKEELFANVKFSYRAYEKQTGSVATPESFFRSSIEFFENHVRSYLGFMLKLCRVKNEWRRQLKEDWGLAETNLNSSKLSGATFQNFLDHLLKNVKGSARNYVSELRQNIRATLDVVIIMMENFPHLVDCVNVNLPPCSFWAGSFDLSEFEISKEIHDEIELFRLWELRRLGHMTFLNYQKIFTYMNKVAENLKELDLFRMICILIDIDGFDGVYETDIIVKALNFFSIVIARKQNLANEGDNMKTIQELKNFFNNDLLRKFAALGSVEVCCALCTFIPVLFPGDASCAPWKGFQENHFSQPQEPCVFYDIFNGVVGPEAVREQITNYNEQIISIEQFMKPFWYLHGFLNFMNTAGGGNGEILKRIVYGNKEASDSKRHVFLQCSQALYKNLFSAAQEILEKFYCLEIDLKDDGKFPTVPLDVINFILEIFCLWGEFHETTESRYAIYFSMMSLLQTLLMLQVSGNLRHHKIPDSSPNCPQTLGEFGKLLLDQMSADISSQIYKKTKVEKKIDQSRMQSQERFAAQCNERCSKYSSESAKVLPSLSDQYRTDVPDEICLRFQKRTRDKVSKKK